MMLSSLNWVCKYNMIMFIYSVLLNEPINYNTIWFNWNTKNWLVVSYNHKDDHTYDLD